MTPTDAIPNPRDDAVASTADSHIHCPECDYNLTGLVGERCPWCGWEVDASALLARAGGWTDAHRLGAAFACVACGTGTLFGLVWLVRGRPALSLGDGLAVVGVTTAAVAHLCVALLLVFCGPRRPSRFRELAAIVRFVGWFSIVLGGVAATTALRTREVNGIPVAATFEFVLVATLYTLPGWTLIVMYFVALREGDGKSWSRIEPSDRADREGAAFAVDAFGDFGQAQIEQTWDASPRKTTPALEASIAAVWQAETELASTTGRLLFDGALIRVAKVEQTQRRLELTLGRTCFRDFLGTNLRSASAVQLASADCMSNALGVSAWIVTSDGFVAFGRRGDRVASHRGHLHCIGGMVEALDQAGDHSVDLFGCVLREIGEELGVEHGLVHELTCVGVVRDLSIHQPEMLFEACLGLTRAELRARFDPARSDGEHTALEFVPLEPEAMLPFLAASAPVTPVAEAAILLAGRRHWGSSWYEQACFLHFGELPTRSDHPRSIG